jgi:acylphosphatase
MSGAGERNEGAHVLARGFRVVGHVQGVGFRWWTGRTARSLGLEGWVRNLGDGSVEVQARGPSEALERLERALHRGPPTARVERVERFGADPSQIGPGFEVRA